MNRMFSEVCYNNASKNRDFEFSLCHKKYVFMLVCLLMYFAVCSCFIFNAFVTFYLHELTTFV